MSTNFPISLDVFVNPSSSNSLDTIGVVHSDQHSNSNDAVAALETKIGINNSTVSSSLDYKINAISSSLLSSTTGIDAKTVAATTLYTVPSGRTAIITNSIIRPMTVSAIIGVATVGIGRNATQDDIFPAAALTGASTITSMFAFSVLGAAAIGSSGDIIKLGVDVPAVAGQMILSCDLIGYLR